jgi:tripartite-type tricarboxylate transporter receptor subunit TctC
MNRIAWILAIALLFFGTAACAQGAWPARPVRLVVPSSPGGGTDFYARLLAQTLSELLKQQFVVDNQPGASGNIGAAAVARATPDGYTFLVSADPALTVNPSLYRNLPYNAERDFEPVAQGVAVPLVLCVHPSVSARSLAALLELGKREPGKLAFGSAGSGSPTYLGVRMIEEASGAKFLHVPFKGIGQAMPSFVSGQVQLLFPDVAIALPFIKAERIVPLAVTQRSLLIPSVPTLAEAGFPDIAVPGFFSVVAPAGTARSIVERMSLEVNNAMRTPSLAKQLESHGFIPVFDTPEQFGARLKTIRAFWAGFIRRSGIEPD